MTSTQEQRLARWIEDPNAFVRECIGAVPDAWQERELLELPKHDRIAIAGSKGCAKTAFESWAIWWALCTQPGVNIAAVSTSGDQLRDSLWKELALWQSKSPLLQALFQWAPERITRKTEPATWFASARKYARDADPNTQGQSLAGLHGKRVMFVIEEAGSVPQAVLAAADAVLATKKPGHRAQLLIAGNTTSSAGALYHAVTKQRQLWHCVRVTSDPDDPFRTPRVPVEWARQQIQAYGRDNPWVKINVFAEFPEQALGKLISLADLEAASERTVEENQREPLVLGVDVGTVIDAAVLFPRRGRLLYPPKVLRGASTIVIAGEVVRLVRECGVVTTFVDMGGPGVGVVDQLRLLGVSCVPVFFGSTADDSSRYADKRTEMYVRGAEWIKEGGATGRCTELVQDMHEPEVTWNLKGQQVLEPKALVKPRLGRSTDWGDAFALTFAYPVAAAPRAGDPELKAIARLMREQQHNEYAYGRDTPEQHNEYGY